MLEKDIERKLVIGVRRMGGAAYKWTSPGNIGVPDRIIMLPEGRIIFAELKTDKGRLSEVQKSQIRKLQSLGCDVRVVYGEEGVKSFLKEMKNGV